MVAVLDERLRKSIDSGSSPSFPSSPSSTATCSSSSTTTSSSSSSCSSSSSSSSSDSSSDSLSSSSDPNSPKKCSPFIIGSSYFVLAVCFVAFMPNTSPYKALPYSSTGGLPHPPGWYPNCAPSGIGADNPGIGNFG